MKVPGGVIPLNRNKGNMIEARAVLGIEPLETEVTSNRKKKKTNPSANKVTLGVE